MNDIYKSSVDNEDFFDQPKKSFIDAPATLMKLEPHRHVITASAIGIVLVLSIASSLPQASVKAEEPVKTIASNIANTPLKIPVIGSSVAPANLPKFVPDYDDKKLSPITLNSKTIIGGWLMSGAEDSFGYVGDVYSFNQLSPFWWEVAGDGVGINDKFNSLPIYQFMFKAKARNIKVYPSITADPNIISLTLASEEKRRQLIDNITDKVVHAGVLGIDIDFELLDETDSPNLVIFLKDLKKTLADKNKTLTVDLEAGIDNKVNLDWRAIGETADFVHIMGYDYHSRLSQIPGPIGPIGWLKDVVDYAKSTVPPEKIILGLGTYGYDWYPAEDGTLRADGLTYADVQALMSENKAQVQRAYGTDERGYEVGDVPYFGYTDQKGIAHFVWYEDKQSILEKMSLLRGIGGVYFWRLDAEDKTIWPEIGKNIPK